MIPKELLVSVETLLKYNIISAEEYTDLAIRIQKTDNSLPEIEASRVIEKEQGESKCVCKTRNVGAFGSGIVRCSCGNLFELDSI